MVGSCYLVKIRLIGKLGAQMLDIPSEILLNFGFMFIKIVLDAVSVGLVQM